MQGEHFTQGCLGSCELEPELETLPGVTRSNSSFECNTNSYPEKPFPLQMAGLWSACPAGKGWMLLGAVGSLPGTSSRSAHLFQQNLGHREG